MISKINEESKDDVTSINPQESINRSSKSILDRNIKNANSLSVDKNSEASSIRYPFRSGTYFQNNPQPFPKKESISTIYSNNMRSKISNEAKKRAKRASLKIATGNTPILLLNSIKNTNNNSPYYKALKKERITIILLGGLSILSIILSLIDNELYISNVKRFYKNKFKEGEFTVFAYSLYEELRNIKLKPEENIIRIFNGIISFSEVIVVYYKYRFILNKNIYEYNLSEYDTLQSSGHLISYILESITALIFFPPFIHHNFTFQIQTLIFILPLNSLFSILTLLKLYFILQTLTLFTRYNSEIAKTICKTHTVSHGLQFVIRCQMKDHPFYAMSILTVIFFFIISAALRIVEFSSYDLILGLIGKKGINDLGSYVNCFWYMIVIATTVGYGDQYPRNILGRLLSLLGWFFGIVGLGLTISSLTSVSEFSEADRKAFLKLQKLYDPENEQHKAVNVVKTVLLLKKMKKKQNEEKISEVMKSDIFKEKCFFIMKLYVETRLFKDKYKVARNYSMPISDLMRTFEGKLYDNVVSFTKHLEKINFVENDFLFLQKTQKFIQNKLTWVNSVQKEICFYLINHHNKTIIENKKRKIKNKKQTYKSVKAYHRNEQKESGIMNNEINNKKETKMRQTGIHKQKQGKFYSVIIGSQVDGNNSGKLRETNLHTLPPERKNKYDKIISNQDTEIQEHIDENEN